MIKPLAWFLVACAASVPAPAATGCDLNYPDRDVARLFPGSTRYVAKYMSLSAEGFSAVLAQLEEPFRAYYDPLNVPYTIYEIYNKESRIGYIHGVNQKGRFGGIQVFVALDLSGKITRFYIQKMTGKSAARLRTETFGRQFQGLSLKDFGSFDPILGKGSGPVAAVRNPAPEEETDFFGVLRGLKKNLVLMDVFIYSPVTEQR